MEITRRIKRKRKKKIKKNMIVRKSKKSKERR
jgi:hypothetical protein